MNMNIFYLHRKRRKCVKYHCDKHVIKMILETAQLLCTAVWVFDPDSIVQDPESKQFAYHGTRVYRKTHENHPCAIWARENKKHFRWLRKFGLYLCKEYTYRYGKTHKTEEILRGLRTPPAMPDGVFHEPPQCMPDQYKVPNDSVQAYRNYYVGEKARMLCWDGKINSRPRPPWVSV
jgi:hypothetical protein